MMGKEKDFEKQVKKYLMEQGCWYFKTWSNGIQAEGIPDLIVCCNGYFLGVEVKAETGEPSKLQLNKIRQIRKAYGIAIVLYPHQFDEFKELIHQLNEMLHYAAWNYQNHFDRKDFWE